VTPVVRQSLCVSRNANRFAGRNTRPGHSGDRGDLPAPLLPLAQAHNELIYGAKHAFKVIRAAIQDYEQEFGG
jgi:hypothetical protein